MTPWGDFFVAEISATAALAGLLFVSLSINVSKILKHPALPDLGAVSLMLLIGSLLELSLCLIPQPQHTLGYEILIVRLFIWLLLNRSLRRQLQVPRQYLRDRMISILQQQAATVPAIVSGVSLIASLPGALYWLASGTLASIALAVYNAWILLIEILR